ncbi:MAG: hypothetical protein M3Z32_09380, partial [Acidobacteriota bacterium]|nr:hypothetical protein [Acidobacteriota bacterium]
PQSESQDPQPGVSVTPGLQPSITPPPQLFAPDVLSSAPSPAPALLPQALGLPMLEDAFKHNPLSIASEDAKRHAEWRDLRNRLAGDPLLQQARTNVERAPTDYEKRKLLRQYYEQYYARMITLAATPELKVYLAVKRNEQLAALPQPRVRPTPTPSASPSPASRR